MTETHNRDLDKEDKKTTSNHSSLSITLSPSKSYGKLCLMPGVKQRKIQQWIDTTQWEFVSYGGVGGIRSVEYLRLVMAELQAGI